MGISPPGEKITPENLLLCFRSGLFTLGPVRHGGYSWWSPDPRFILDPKNLHVGRSLRKILRRDEFVIRTDTRFEEVVHQCAYTREKTWLTKELQDSLLELHFKGFAHSYEVYQDEDLVGGLYGVSLGHVFFGESMFSLVNNASKAALVTLAMSRPDYLIDCQLRSPHVAALGGRLVSRQRFEQMLRQKVSEPSIPQLWKLEIDSSDLVQQ